MKKLILVAVILQLVIIIISAKPTTAPPRKYKFGDILAFPKKCFENIAKPLFNHYAVYVGPQSEVDVGQGENNDIVHRIGPGQSSCQFGQIAEERRGFSEIVHNYLDGVERDEGGKYTPGTTKEIKARITDLMKNCTKYKTLSNNCEHFATKVRYNVSVAMQIGTESQYFVVKSRKAKELLARIKQDLAEEVKCEKIS